MITRLREGSLRAGVVFAIWREDIEYLGVLKGGGLVFDVARDEEAVASAGFDGASGMGEGDVAADDVDHLLMRMTMASSDPAPGHGVAHQHHGWTIGHDLAAEARLGRGHVFIIRRDNRYCFGQECSPDGRTVSRLMQRASGKDCINSSG